MTLGVSLDIRCSKTLALEVPLNLSPRSVERDQVGGTSQASCGRSLAGA